MNMKVPKFLTNKYVLYLVVFLSITNMIGYLVMGNLNSLIYFLIVGLITSIFTQNMCIILLSALLLSNILIAGQNSYTEGFTDTKTSSEDTATTTTTTNKPKTTNIGKTDTLKTNTPKTNKPMTNTSNVGKLATPINDGPMEESTDTTKNTESEPTTDEAFEVGMENSNKKNYRVDYASTIEDAYGQLNQILGSDGIKRLTDDTQNLLKQQIQLADAMKSMGPLISNMAPLIEQTKGLMNGVGGFDIKDLGSFASLAKGFSSSSNTP